MFQDILAVAMGVIVLSAGVWVWWIDNGKGRKEEK